MSVALRRRMSPLTSRSIWSCSCPVCWKQAVFVSAWLAGPRQVRRGAWIDALDTAQRSTAPHARRLHVIDVTQMS